MMTQLMSGHMMAPRDRVNQEVGSAAVTPDFEFSGQSAVWLVLGRPAVRSLPEHMVGAAPTTRPPPHFISIFRVMPMGCDPRRC